MPTMKAEAAGAKLDLAPGSRVGIIAGGGSLPVEVAASLARQGHPPVIIAAEGEVDRKQDLAGYETEQLALESFGSLVPLLRRKRISHLVLAGEIRRRPKLTAMRPSLGLLAAVPTVVMGLARGDDGLLRMLTRFLEKRGIKVVGAHEIVPELLASDGSLTT
ncbi:MAG: DUF1009 domain-containing protein, partial [Mesorhizobium sp.]